MTTLLSDDLNCSPQTGLFKQWPPAVFSYTITETLLLFQLDMLAIVSDHTRARACTALTLYLSLITYRVILWFCSVRCADRLLDLAAGVTGFAHRLAHGILWWGVWSMYIYTALVYYYTQLCASRSRPPPWLTSTSALLKFGGCCRSHLDSTSR